MTLTPTHFLLLRPGAPHAGAIIPSAAVRLWPREGNQDENQRHSHLSWNPHDGRVETTCCVCCRCGVRLVIVRCSMVANRCMQYSSVYSRCISSYRLLCILYIRHRTMTVTSWRRGARHLFTISKPFSFTAVRCMSMSAWACLLVYVCVGTCGTRWQRAFVRGYLWSRANRVLMSVCIVTHSYGWGTVLGVNLG